MEVSPFAFEKEQNNRIELANSRITIFPNPATSQIHISGAEKGTRISIYDLSGRIILIKNIDTEILDVEMLESGMYLIEVQSKGITETQRLVVSK